ncbi:L-threonylcarbamoyladenylate synthase [Effusibacillus dendaii]|uniref:Threonylcarbamoyl-AMP synthase n=1 Tax=Effusibacillus dendaii TaxID=2743772 RepID=A0A7I8DC50_9BACL|nr:L-threonylcarbamoyladenylate synthase [Effusibacillus dendaii]BCJ87664.1 threonylcarbamoyl-AMP synthase [Effusibacillus dendaii]
MDTVKLTTSEHDLERAAKLLRQGELVAFPTETVYGLGANALDAEAVKRIFAAKGRPSDNPLIVHIASRQQLAELVTHVPEAAERLIDLFWPGPLTLLLPKRSEVPDRVTAGLPTVAIRMPSHPAALHLLEKSGVPVAAPSANRSGRPSPTEAAHVLEDLQGEVAAVVDGGTTGIGVESTVLDVTVNPPMILRPGGVTREMLQQAIGQVQEDPSLRSRSADLDPSQAGEASDTANEPVPRAPGMKYRHYAPKAEMWIVEGEEDEQRKRIQALVDQSRANGIQTGVLTTEEQKHLYHADLVIACGRRSEPETVAGELYRALRQFDQTPVQRIYAESFPETGLGAAIMNRMRKAAGYRVVS